MSTAAMTAPSFTAARADTMAKERHYLRMGITEVVVAVVLLAGAGLVFWGSSFATNMVHDQLSDQRISFPVKGSPALDPKAFPGLQQYAGQAVDNGPKAKAYANQFINVHLKGIAGGHTYSQVSAKAQQAPTDQKLAGQAQTLFRGETLRGLLLYAWGWWLVGRIALFVAIGLMAAGLVIVFASLLPLLRARKEHFAEA